MAWVGTAIAVGAAAAEEFIFEPMQEQRRAQRQAQQQVEQANRQLREQTASDAEKRQASFDAAARQRARAAGAGGRASTILTGPLGLPGEPQGGRRKTLLGQ